MMVQNLVLKLRDHNMKRVRGVKKIEKTRKVKKVIEKIR